MYKEKESGRSMVKMLGVLAIIGVLSVVGIASDAAADLNTTAPTPSSPTGNECTDTCQNGATCVNGYCECPSGQVWTPSDNSGNGECGKITEGDCKTNTDCEAGKYCAIRSTEYDCEKPDNGTCTTLDSGKKTIYNGKTFLYSSGTMSWWAARNWCLAHGKSLASLSDLGITRPASSCSGSNCAGADWTALKEAFGSSYYWTNDSKSSCYVFNIHAYIQHVDADYRDNCLSYALCR